MRHLFIALIALISLSGCNAFTGLKMDFQNMTHMAATGIVPDGYPDGRQQVNYHQTLLQQPQPDYRYYLNRNISRYY